MLSSDWRGVLGPRWGEVEAPPDASILADTQAVTCGVFTLGAMLVWAIAHWAVANAARLDIRTIIFDDRIWHAGSRSDAGWTDYRRITVLLNADEEIGSTGSAPLRTITDRSPRGPSLLLIGDLLPALGAFATAAIGVVVGFRPHGAGVETLHRQSAHAQARPVTVAAAGARRAACPSAPTAPAR